MHEGMCACMHAVRNNVRMTACKRAVMDGCMGMDGWMDGRMDICTYVRIIVSTYV